MILLTVRWYLRYNLSFRDLVEMMEGRGLFLAHTTIMRWVHQYGPELDERVRRHLKPTNDSWRVDETYVKVKGQWMYLYRAVDSKGNTIDFYLSKKRNHKGSGAKFSKLKYTLEKDERERNKWDILKKNDNSSRRLLLSFFFKLSRCN
ncbi:IS6 family transposase [Bacillus sp. DX4.1]|uniref:IS6 family transposase n=1 Tax=Bacillus sp. DX4.1 TaxID=3055867 RepID=UPI0025A1F8FE|nr:IS6 family transposase [Bacillus sp. DX4.1]MDM5185999.1 IS6 family transposase [Bacillus sp. DX4.1]